MIDPGAMVAALSQWRAKLAQALPHAERALAVLSLPFDVAHLRARRDAIALEIETHEAEMAAEAAEAEVARAVEAAVVAAARHPKEVTRVAEGGSQLSSDDGGGGGVPGQARLPGRAAHSWLGALAWLRLRSPDCRRRSCPFCFPRRTGDDAAAAQD